MRSSSFGLIGAVLFLGVYAFVKYAAAAPPQFNAGYATNVGILVAMTGLAPYLLSLGVAKAVPGGRAPRLAASTLAGVVFCVGAYALFFKMYIEGAAPGADIVDVARRGVGWGAVEGALAGLTAGASNRRD